MAFVFDATVGGTAANSYVSVEDADSYFASRIGSTDWPTVELTKQQALASATTRLDGEDWFGYRATSEQRLAWPRGGLTTKDGIIVEYDEIPFDILVATCELAYHLIGVSAAGDESALSQYSKVSVGPVSVELKADAQPVTRDDLPSSVRRWIRPYGRTTASGNFRITRG